MLLRNGLLSSCSSASFLFLGYWIVCKEELREEEVLLKGGESCPPAFAPLLILRRLEFGEVGMVVFVVVVAVDDLRRAEEP